VAALRLRIVARRVRRDRAVDAITSTLFGRMVVTEGRVE
jgi:hypothetical protein